MKNFSLSMLIILNLFFANDVYSQEFTPKIKYNDTYRVLKKFDEFYRQNYYNTYFEFNRWVYLDKKFFIDFVKEEEAEVDKLFGLNYSEEKLDKNYELLDIWKLRLVPFGRILDRSFFILKNNKSIGYILMDTILTSVTLPKIEINDPLLDEIKSLPINNKYLQVKLPKDMTINFYQVERNDNYIEVYGIARTGYIEIFMLEAFYPKELHNKLKNKVMKTLNRNLKRYYDIERWGNNKLSEEETYEIHSKMVEQDDKLKLGIDLALDIE